MWSGVGEASAVLGSGSMKWRIRNQANRVDVAQQREKEGDWSSGVGSATPLVSALSASAQKDAARFHFPGHNRGRGAPSSLTHIISPNPYLHDLPELPQLGNLFSPDGPLLEAQSLASALFGAAQTWFLVNGTTCGIHAAIMATCPPNHHLVLPRNSHLSVFSALVLSGALPKYILPAYDHTWELPSSISARHVSLAIHELLSEGKSPSAVLITSPTYHGICSNVEEISLVCKAHGIPLIVDEAHGAHFGFHPLLPRSSLQQGADIVVQSTHKVLTSLTQSSMLHVSGEIVDRNKISRCLQTLQSTSPNYLLLASLDAARAQIGENPERFFDSALQLAGETKNAISRLPGMNVLTSSCLSGCPAVDPLRITVGTDGCGYELDDALEREYGVISEVSGPRSVTFVVSHGTTREDAERLVAALKGLSAREMLDVNPKCSSYAFAGAAMVLSPRDAFFCKKKRVSLDDSVGKVAGEMFCPYPPGIPLLHPGEIITRQDLQLLSEIRSKGAVLTGVSDPHLGSLLICDI